MHKIDTEKYIVSAREAGTEKAEDREEADRLKNYGWRNVSGPQRDEIMAYAEEYMSFLNAAKTEREAVKVIRRMAEERGFEEISKKESLKPGDRVYGVNKDKSMFLAVIGEEALTSGFHAVGAHIDAPRLDLKQNPLYEDSGFALFKTHYYGGIKKYQWVAIPLALHGVIVRKTGEKVIINIGEDENDPVFCISDLLVHLAQEQMTKNAKEVVEGEALNLIVGGRPLEGEEKDAVKANVLKLLADKYGVEEEDFLSAELEIVPAGKARDMGFDRSMILAYGHDDRVCAYPSMMAVLDYEGTPEYTLCCIVTDKEEIGSVGATGMASHYLENTVAELYACTADYCELAVRRCLRNSRMLSSDVSAGYDPNFASAFEKKNSAFLGRGICFNKFTGSRGKSGSNDANPEFMASLRKIMDDAGVAFQTAELGRVDLGGGGTIAYLCAKYGMNVIDSGIPVLSMHAPYEVISKVDLYEGYRGYCAFLQGAKPVE